MRSCEPLSVAKLFLVARTDDPDYDEYSAIVVCANDMSHAWNIALSTRDKRQWNTGATIQVPVYEGFTSRNTYVHEIGTAHSSTEIGVVIADFRAG